jgi:hypothetical protein
VSGYTLDAALRDACGLVEYGDGGQPLFKTWSAAGREAAVQAIARGLVEFARINLWWGEELKVKFMEELYWSRELIEATRNPTAYIRTIWRNVRRCESGIRRDAVGSCEGVDPTNIVNPLTSGLWHAGNLFHEEVVRDFLSGLVDYWRRQEMGPEAANDPLATPDLEEVNYHRVTRSMIGRLERIVRGTPEAPNDAGLEYLGLHEHEMHFRLAVCANLSQRKWHIYLASLVGHTSGWLRTRAKRCRNRLGISFEALGPLKKTWFRRRA